MRFIEGETLKAKLAREPLSMQEALEIVHGIGAALTYAHGAGVLHRDVKPSNVMLTSKGQVFLTDFGLARLAQAGESTMSQDAVLGTPQYISPEQAMGHANLDERTDVYSLGVVVYELLVGRTPYQADTPFAVVHDHIFTPLPMPRAINPNLPEILERVLLKALAKEPGERFQSVEAMIEALDHAVAQVSVSWLGSRPAVSRASSMIASRTASTVKAISRPSTPTSNPLLWAGLGAIVVLATVGVVFATRPNPPPATAPPPPPPADQATQQSLDAVMQQIQQASDRVMDREFDAARDMFKQAAELAERGLSTLTAPGTPIEFRLREAAAQSWLASGAVDRAEPHFNWMVGAAGQEMGRAQAFLGLAAAELIQEQPAEAIEHADAALGIVQGFAPAHAVRWCAFLKQGDRRQAASELRFINGEAARNGPGIPPWARLVLRDIDCTLES
jgi:hypothetical protein